MCRKIIISIVLVLVSSQAQAGNLVMFEQFNESLSGWSVSGDAQIVTQDYNAKVRLGDAPTNTAATVMSVLDAFDNVLITISVGSVANQITFATNASAASSASLNAGQYRQIILRVIGGNAYVWYSEADTTNGVPVALGAIKAFTGTPAAIRYAKGSTSMTRTFTPPASGWLLEYDINYSSAYTYLDEIKIYGPDIFMIGDSRTDGKMIWSNHPGWSGRVAASNDETSPPNYHLSALLGESWVANRGFGNARLSQIVSRISGTVIDQGARRVVISAGHNDIYLGDNLTAMQGYMASIVASLEAAGITGHNIILCDSVISYVIDTPAEKTLLQDWNTWLESYAAANGYAYINTRSLLENPPGTISASYDQGDHIHFNSAGSGVIADLIYAAFIVPMDISGEYASAHAGNILTYGGPAFNQYVDGQWTRVPIVNMDGSDVLIKEITRW